MGANYGNGPHGIAILLLIFIIYLFGFDATPPQYFYAIFPLAIGMSLIFGGVRSVRRGSGGHLLFGSALLIVGVVITIGGAAYPLLVTRGAYVEQAAILLGGVLLALALVVAEAFLPQESVE